MLVEILQLMGGLLVEFHMGKKIDWPQVLLNFPGQLCKRIRCLIIEKNSIQNTIVKILKKIKLKKIRHFPYFLDGIFFIKIPHSTF